MKLYKLFAMFVAAMAVGFLTGCSSLGSTPEPAPVAVAAPAPITVIAAPAPIVVEPTIEENTGGRIAIGTLLNKLVLSGCTIDKIIYREVRRGGHVEVSCLTTNDLALDSKL